MRAADTRGLPPPPPHFLEPHLDGVPPQGIDGSQYVYSERYEMPQMRMESSEASDIVSTFSHRSAATTPDESDVRAKTSPGEREPEGEREDEDPSAPPRPRRVEDDDRRRGSSVERQMQRLRNYPDSGSRRSDLEVELASKEREVSHLVDEMERLQSSINNLKEISTTKISQLEDMVSEKDRIIKDLAEKLLRQKDYGDLKRELRLLKALELGGWQPWLAPELQASSELASPAEGVKAGLTGNGRASSPGAEEAGEEEEEDLESGSPCSNGTPPPLEKNTLSPPPYDSSGPAGRLQRCLREGLGRLGEPLDTRGVAGGVRELLGAHGIGQRLFARLVLGLSQGTVSELLSKPKPWAKLTEKGRDSYRKMAAFASDPVCVHLLKAALPRKGREGSVPKSDAGSSPRPEGATGVNIAPEEKLDDTAPSPQKDVHPSPLGSFDAPRPFPCAPPPEFSPMVLAHIYQEELLKLLGKRLKVEGGNEDLPKHEEVRRALSIYHRELALLAVHGAGPPTSRAERRPCGPPPGFCPAEQHCCCLQPTDPGPYAVLSPYSAATQPLMPLEGTPQGAEESSPLQRMQSITNSLLSQSSAGPGPLGPLQGSQRPSKAVLPPITQQQFDAYNNLNTEEIVKRVKEQLSQYSISQRLFGESVLGLSQGSVSDLLARPKPWPMLTQKGREPFIRMQMFLEDEGAVHKLVASQYKVAPERLMRLGGGAYPTSHGPPRFSPVCSEPSYITSQRSQPTTAPPHPPSPQRPPSAPESPSGIGSLPRAGGRRGCGTRGLLLPTCTAQPSVYEMAAVTSDLDTHLVTARIKETLTVHNIGQKLFGEAVLGLSQGSVSELLSKPKPWHMLSIKGREPFIRMQLWLQDPHNVEKLQAIKSERREANKRRRSNVEVEMPPPPLPCETKPTPPQYLQGHLPPGYLYPPAKRPRVLFSEEQKEAMKLAYALDPYPSTTVMEFLSAELGLSVRTITNWFHNHRMRLKQQNGDEPDGSLAHQQQPQQQQQQSPPNDAGSFDPIRFRVLLGQRLAEMCSKSATSTSICPSNDEPKLCCSFGDPSNRSDSEPDTLDLSMSNQRLAKSISPVPVEEKKPLSPLACQKSPSPLQSSSEHKMHTQFLCLRDNANELSESSTMTQNNSQGSNRRKPAAPQWINPGLDLSPDSDLCSLDDDEEQEDSTTGEDNNSGNLVKKQIINGVCVRQTDLARAEEGLESNLVHVLPVPAPDDRARLEREENIRRLERAIVEEEERWDLSESEEEDQDECHIELTQDQDPRL